MKALSIWKNDIKEILKSSYMTVAVIAIILIPLVYGGLYLAAFWDPYGSTDQLPVVVVNQDTGYINDDNVSLNYGKDVANSLRYNDDLGWVFEEDIEKAKDGLINEGYYAMFIIPEDFSKTLDGLRNGKLVQPVIQYIPNEKKNYIVSLINKKASGAIENSVSKSLSGVFTSVVFEQLEYLKDKINTGSEAVYLLEAGVSKLNTSVPKLQYGLEKVNDGTSILEEKLGDASDGVTTLNDAVTTLNEKIPALLDGTEKIYKGSETFNEKLGEAYDGTNSLGDALASYHDKLPAVQDATQSLSEASGQIDESLEKLSDKSKDVKIAVEAITSGLDELLEGLKTASSGSDELTEKYTSIESGFFKLANMQIDSTKANLSQLKALGYPPLTANVDKALVSLDALNSFDYYEFERRQYISDPTKELNLAYAEINTLLGKFGVDMSSVSSDLNVVIAGLKAQRSGVKTAQDATDDKATIIAYQNTLITLDETITKLEAQTNPALASASLASLKELIYGKASIQAYGVSNNSLASGLS
ncbi:MAG: YhgE/Pip family protein, partial [Acidaminobacteraceae bacterium]